MVIGYSLFCKSKKLCLSEREKLLVIGYSLLVKGNSCGLRVAGCELRVKCEKGKVMDYSLKFFVSLLAGIKGIESMFSDRKSI